MKLVKILALILAAGLLFAGPLSTATLMAQDSGAQTEQSAPATGDDATAAESSSSGADMSFWDVVSSGTVLDQIVWVFIFLTSLATVALIVDGFISIRAGRIMPVHMVTAIKNALDEGDLGQAIEICESSPGPLANILMAGFNNIQEGYDVILESVSSAASIESEKLMQRVNYLNLCGQLAPMFGLMGTVTGMVAAFAGLATATGANKATTLALSISGALYTTAVGLFIAVPAILGFTFIKNSASKIILTMEALTYDLIKVLRDAEVDSNAAAAGEEAAFTEEEYAEEEYAEGEEEQ